MLTRRTAALTLSLVALFITGGLLYAGPLNPPTGPITSTYKTLQEVEPRIALSSVNTPGDANSVFRITQPGSYHLADNISPISGKHGIEIAASNVTIDLNGFELLGDPASGDLDGITVAINGLTNISISNGSVRGWSGFGIQLGTASDFRIEEILAEANTGGGIFVGNGGAITRCTAYGNGYSGIVAGEGNIISNCSARFNLNDGVSTASNCIVTNCASYNNYWDGISVTFGCSITLCATNGNVNAGVTANEDSILSHVTSAGNNTGIAAYVRCSVINCVTQSNHVNGIVCTSGCVIRGNSCNDTHGGDGVSVGIHVIGSNCRIENNSCMTNDLGFRIENPGNLILKNTCSGNITNWSIAAGNALGPIVVASPSASLFSGDSSPESIGSTHPNANFTR